MAEGRTRRCGRRPAGGWNPAAGGSPVAVAAPSGRLRPGGFGGLEAEHVSCTPAGAREGKGSAVLGRIPLCARCMPNPSSSRGALKTLRHTAVPPRGWRFKRVGRSAFRRNRGSRGRLPCGPISPPYLPLSRRSRTRCSTGSSTSSRRSAPRLDAGSRDVG